MHYPSYDFILRFRLALRFSLMFIVKVKFRDNIIVRLKSESTLVKIHQLRILLMFFSDIGLRFMFGFKFRLILCYKFRFWCSVNINITVSNLRVNINIV